MIIRRTFVRACALVALSTLAVLGGCGSDDPTSSSEVSVADAYNAAIRWYLQGVPAPPDTTETKPTVVYVAPANGKPIDVQTQADVAAEMSDMDDVVIVRFADARDDALELDIEGQPVKDDGVLLLVGEVEEGPPPVQLDVGVYHNTDDEGLYSMTITRVGDSFVASTVSSIAQG